MYTMPITTSKINRIYLTFPKGATALNSTIFVGSKSYFIEKLHSKFH